LKISIITVCFNSEKTIEKTIQSVLSQNYNNIEYIVIDGKSQDGTIKIINEYIDRIDYFISEPDLGIYDALNKGILRSTGDIVGILNSDDEFSKVDILSTIANYFIQDVKLDSIIGDVIFINKNEKKIRKYTSSNWKNSWFSWGFMPPHPSFYCRRDLYEDLGLFNITFKIASDFDLLLRFLKINSISYKHIPMTMVIMKTGGVSTRGFKSILTINKEILQICKMHGVKTNYIKIYFKYFYKVFDFFKIHF
jgi:glycosyltransferase involved in cell wall biosynthesis